MAGAAVATVGGAVVGGLAARRLLDARRQGTRSLLQPGRDGQPRWHVVTVYRPMDQLSQLPEPLTELGADVETRLRPAPDDRGTEIAARPRGAEQIHGEDPHRAVRGALRRAKQLVETGEVLQPNRPATTRRTVLNRPLEYATRHGREEGRI